MGDDTRTKVLDLMNQKAKIEDEINKNGQILAKV